MERSGDEPGVPLWKNRDYALFWGAQTVSWLGSGISQAAFPLLVLSLSGSAAKAGISLALVALPRVVFGLPAGALVDRFDRRWLMVASSLLQAVSCAGVVALLYAGLLQPAYLFLFAGIQGSAGALFEVANDSVLPRLVRKEQVPAAVSAFQLSMAASAIAGPLVGGVLFKLWHPAAPFLVDGISFVLGAAGLLPIRASFQAERGATLPPMRDHIREGLRWVAERPALLAMLALHAAVAFYFAGGMLTCVTRAVELGADGSAVGGLFSISAGGSIVGAMVAGRWVPRLRPGRVMVGSVLVLGLLIVAVGVAPSYWYIGVICALTLALNSFFGVSVFSLRAEWVPDERQGRVIAIFEVAAALAQPVGYVAAGLLFDWAGVGITAWVFGALVIAVALSVSLGRVLRGTPAWVPAGSSSSGG